MDDLQLIIATRLQREGAGEFETLASLIVADLRFYLGGSAVYFDKGIAARNERIRGEFNGRNADCLAVQYGLTKKRIQQIVS